VEDCGSCGGISFALSDRVCQAQVDGFTQSSLVFAGRGQNGVVKFRAKLRTGIRGFRRPLKAGNRPGGSAEGVAFSHPHHDGPYSRCRYKMTPNMTTRQFSRPIDRFRRLVYTPSDRIFIPTEEFVWKFRLHLVELETETQGFSRKRIARSFRAPFNGTICKLSSKAPRKLMVKGPDRTVEKYARRNAH